MFAIDDDFLAEAGLGSMPHDERAEFLRLVYETLEARVGEALSRGLSDGQMIEFDSLIERQPEQVATWIDDNVPDFLGDPVYSRMKEVLAGKEDPAGILCEYAATKWLEVNRPNYRAVVASELEGLKTELIERAPQILATSDRSA